MVLNIIGIGLGDEKDITVRGLELVKQSDLVVLEGYTSKLLSDTGLSSFYGKKVVIADRNFVEKEAEEKLLKPAKTSNVSFLVIGDPLGATTHNDLIRRAEQNGVVVNIVHNTGIMNAIADTGLSLYKFGKTTSIPFISPGFEPDSFIEVVAQNKSINAHTLLLLDLRPDEKKFMTANEALIRIAGVAIKKGIKDINENTKVICCARLGTSGAQIAYGALKRLITHNLGSAPHCVIIPAQLHFAEEEALEKFRV
jgi:diphthine synthase